MYSLIPGQKYVRIELADRSVLKYGARPDTYLVSIPQFSEWSDDVGGPKNEFKYLVGVHTVINMCI